MEWMNNNILAPMSGTVLTLLFGYHWYDKRQRDARFDKGEDRMKSLEQEIETLDKHLLRSVGQQDVIQAKLNGLKEIVDVRLNTLSDSMNRVEDLCATLASRK